jgi:hypothetical protein
MKTITAIQLIQKEARFLGMSIVEVMKDVEKHGRMMYSDRVVEAVRVIANN